jgi:branched-chain amino acid transport system ATP-binding protein
MEQSDSRASHADAAPSGVGNPRLSVVGAVKHFGGVSALAGVDLDLHPGEILGLIGPNGSGKTTLVNCVSGALRLTDGRVILEGETITNWSRVRRAKRGVARTFQNLQLFSGLTVGENVAVGLSARRTNRWEGNETVGGLLARLGLSDLSRVVVSRLPYGLQRRVEIARALASDPSVLLLDEPAAGLNDEETADLRVTLETIRDAFGCSLLVIDHDMELVMKVSHRIQALDEGQVVFVGPPDQAFKQKRVVEAYLGTA